MGFYRSSATNTTSGCPALGGQDPANSCRYTNADYTLDGVNYTGGSTLFFEHNVYVKDAYVHGNLVVAGNFDSANGKYGSGSPRMYMPTTAWKQYCRSWATYKAWDAAAAPSFPGLDSAYESDEDINVVGSKVLVNGLMYVGGNAGLGNGGGNAEFYGVIYVVGQVSLDSNSQATVYYNKGAAENIRTAKIILSRTSWKDSLRTWPPGL